MNLTPSEPRSIAASKDANQSGSTSFSDLVSPLISPANTGPLAKALEQLDPEGGDNNSEIESLSDRDNDWVYDDGNFQEYVEELSLLEEPEKAIKSFEKMKEAAMDVNDHLAASRAERLEYMSERLYYRKQQAATEGNDESKLEALDDVSEFKREFSQNELLAPDFAAKIEEEENQKEHGEGEVVLPQHMRRHKVCAAFGHSLERNGANNFLLYLVRHLDRYEEYHFDIYSPKDGPMKADYENMGMTVTVLNKESDDYVEELRSCLRRSQFAIVNTIMCPEVVNQAHALRVPNLWVIHEAWPRDQIDHYAKEVFLMKHVDIDVITSAFATADQIIFPARVQLRCYEGLFDPSRAKVVYNGIPLTAINVFAASADRDQVRTSLGYSANDLVILHLGTVCKRKAQHLSVEAFVKFCTEYPQLARNAKLLMVGARYIRDHEIKYIDNLKATLSKNGLTDRVKILDIKKNVLPFYKAADVVVVPSLNEVLPLVICEAMAFERPVIASNIDGIPEAMDSGREGILIPPGDTDAFKEALRRLSDVSLRCQMGRRGRLRVNEQFGFDKWAEQYRKCMEGVVQRYEATDQMGGVMPALRQPIVLVDMDNTLIDFDDAFQERWREVNPVHAQANPMLVFNRQHFEIEQNFAPPLRPSVINVITEPGFYTSLKPFPGALQALEEMVYMGYNVILCTSPHPSCYSTCVAEKYQWVQEHLGEEWMSLLVITHDKSALRGDILIDDKPDVVGAVDSPEFCHVVFDAPYNRGVKDVTEDGYSRRLFSWSCWRQVLLPLLDNNRRAKMAETTGVQRTFGDLN